MTTQCAYLQVVTDRTCVSWVAAWTTTELHQRSAVTSLSSSSSTMCSVAAVLSLSFHWHQRLTRRRLSASVQPAGDTTTTPRRDHTTIILDVNFAKVRQIKPAQLTFLAHYKRLSIYLLTYLLTYLPQRCWIQLKIVVISVRKKCYISGDLYSL